MGRIDWLRGAYTVFSQAVLAIALEFGAFFDEKWWMVRLDWADGGERNGWEGYGGKSMYIHKKDSCVHKNLTYPFTNKDFYATIKIRRYCREIKNRRKVLSQFYP